MTAGWPLFCTTDPGGCWELCAVVITTRYQLSNLHANVCKSGVYTAQHGCYRNVCFHALSRNPTIFMEILRRSDVDSDITGRRVEFFTDENKLIWVLIYRMLWFLFGQFSWQLRKSRDGFMCGCVSVCLFVWVCWTGMTCEWHQALMALINHNPSLNHKDDLQKLSKGLELKKLSLLMLNVRKPVLKVLGVPNIPSHRMNSS